MTDHTPNDLTAGLTNGYSPTHLYFAYGSNLDAEQMAYRCPGASPVGPAILDGWAFRIGARSYATVSPSSAPGAHVWGGLWLLTDGDLASLDRYEGVRGGLYRREVLEVLAPDLDGTPTDAIVYIENYDDTGWPTEHYLDRILVGARHFGLPSEWIDELAAWAP